MDWLWNEKRKQNYQGCIVSKILERPNTKSLNLFIVTGKIENCGRIK